MLETAFPVTFPGAVGACPSTGPGVVTVAGVACLADALPAASMAVTW